MNIDSLNLAATEADFKRFDSDFDGYVTGADVKEPLIASGLPQMTLAKLWELVDINHCGRLSHAQFTLLTYLVKECRQGAQVPDYLTPQILQWISPTVTMNIESLDLAATEADFKRFDTDFDGYVNGADVKEPLIASGLPQMTLAKLWALVDINHSGRLNHAQFTLLIHLVKESRQGTTIPEYLPSHLLQWISSASSPPKVQLPPNPKIDELNGEIAEQREERRKAEQDLVQLDADTSVKNAEIKNAEIELYTLNATVKQLRNQRAEAAKRLADLDDKILRLESQCEELTKRLKNEEERVNSVKEEIKSAEQNQEAEQKVVNDLRNELGQLDAKHEHDQAQLSRENAEMERIVDELTRVEWHVDTNKEDMIRLEKMINELTAELKVADALESPTGNESLLFRQFQMISSNGVVNVPGSPSDQKPSTAPQRPAPPTLCSVAAAFSENTNRPLYDTVAVDPFKSR
ncbi:Epidermal growth factor receptor substrate 15-like 1 [Aphelenchoides besseyi]|nr:Epidermal growth factor receptor substrate 15-like 1 [Aphelenchoides besseyi]KAI6211580.1 Epidermal growth factor receptor substrate 15-like 1 [Aphelenchoides besseyi]